MWLWGVSHLATPTNETWKPYGSRLFWHRGTRFCGGQLALRIGRRVVRSPQSHVCLKVGTRCHTPWELGVAKHGNQVSHTMRIGWRTPWESGVAHHVNQVEIKVPFRGVAHVVNMFCMIREKAPYPPDSQARNTWIKHTYHHAESSELGHLRLL